MGLFNSVISMGEFRLQIRNLRIFLLRIKHTCVFFDPVAPLSNSNQYFLINETFFDEDDDFDYDSLTIINRSNGLVESSSKIFEYFHQMHVYLDKFLITFSDDTCILKTYNLKGDLLGKITLKLL
jgi:hypothetical protein